MTKVVKDWRTVLYFDLLLFCNDYLHINMLPNNVKSRGRKNLMPIATILTIIYNFVVSNIRN